MRLDKYLSDMKCAPRSQLKKDIKNGLVTVDGNIIRQSGYQVDKAQEICYKGIPCVYEKYVYYMLNKPAGVISATEDKREKTVLSLLSDKERVKDLFPVGRLDKDTEGLLILTNDGMLAHKLLSPAKHVEKVYECLLREPLTSEQKFLLEQGVDIGEVKKTLPAKVSIPDAAIPESDTDTNVNRIFLTITEGKFHQVKRMLLAVGNEVMHLKRLRMGGLSLDEGLKAGEYRKLGKEEVTLLQELQEQKTFSLDEFDAVIFDLDGSLVDSMWLWHAIDVEYLGRFGMEAPADLQSRIGGRSFSETAVYFKETFAIPDTLDEIKAAWNQMAWDKYTYEVPLKEGVRELINVCMQKKIKLGIATSNSRELVDNIITVHKLNPHFDAVMTGCEVEKGKPAPDIYLAVARALNVSPERCLVFEDIVHGIMAGRAAGMKVCAVYDKHSEAQDEEKRKLADYYIHDFRELI